jgi:hypothetical protein
MNTVPPINQNPTDTAINTTATYLNNATNSIKSTVNSISNTVSSGVNQFSNNINTNVDAPEEFLYSNTLIAKFAFLILIVLVFLFLLNLGIMLIQYFTSPSNEPTIVPGMIDGNVSLSVSQDPTNVESKLILRSNNESSGLEFTWSVWLYINELSNEETIYQHIFNKGDSNINMYGIANVNNAPGLYLKSDKNNNINTATLHIIMDSNDSYDKSNFIDIKDVPIKKWVNVVIRMKNTILDSYVNGVISGRLIMKDVPNQNYNNVNVNQNRGFSGKLSNLKYYNRALNIFEINSIVSKGPDMTYYNTTKEPTNFSYLSQLWYTSKL